MPEMTEELQQALTLDIAAAVDDIALGVGLTPEEAPPEEGAANEPADSPPTTVSAQEVPPSPAEATSTAAAPTDVPAALSADDTPHTWRKEAKELWAALPPAVREEVVKREQDIQRYVDQVKPTVAVGSEFQKIAGPYLESFAKANINVFDNYKASLEVQRILAFGSPQEKMQIVQTLAQTAGLTLDGTTLSAPANADQEYVRTLEDRVKKLEGSVGTVTSTVREAQIQELSQSALAFLQDKENHPYAIELSDDMNKLIEKGLATTLEEAYRQAVNASPVHRQKLIDAETDKRLKQRSDEEAARVVTAKTAAAANVRSNGSRRAPPPAESLDDTLTNTLADINSRAH